MTYYQLVCLIPATLEPNEVEKIQNNVREILNQNEAKIIKEFEPEKKRLAYAIKQIRHGIYLKLNFEIAQDKLQSVQKNLKLTGQVVRFILTKEKQSNKKIKARRRPPAPRVEAEKTEPAPTEDKTSRKVRGKKPEMSLEELDKKLDEILDN